MMQGDLVAAWDWPQGKNAELESVIVIMIRRKKGNNDSNSNNPFKMVCTNFDAQWTKAGNIQTQDPTYIQNTDLGKTGFSGDRDK